MWVVACPRPGGKQVVLEMIAPYHLLCRLRRACWPFMHVWWHPLASAPGTSSVLLINF